MDVVYVDHQIITAFLLQNHKHHVYAVNDIAEFLGNDYHYYCSINGLFVTIQKLIRELSTAKERHLLPAEFELGKEVVGKVYSVVKKLNIKILFTYNQKVFSQALSLQSEYKIRFEVAFYTAMLLEHKIDTIATYDEGYDVLFSEGLLKKYGV